MKYSQKDNRTNQLQIFLAEILINRTPWSAFLKTASYVVFSTTPPKYARYTEPAIWHSGSILTHARHHLGEFIIFRGRTAMLLPFLRSITNFCTLNTIAFPPSSAVYCRARLLIHRYSQEWSNVKCLRSLTWEILLIIQRCMKNLAFHSSLRWKITIATKNSQYLICMHFFWKVGTFSNSGMKRLNNVLTPLKDGSRKRWACTHGEPDNTFECIVVQMSGVSSRSLFRPFRSSLSAPTSFPPICASVTSIVTFNCPRHLPHQHPRPCYFHRHHPHPRHHPRVSKMSRSSLIVFLAVHPMGHRIVLWLILYLAWAWRPLPEFQLDPLLRTLRLVFIWKIGVSFKQKLHFV